MPSWGPSPFLLPASADAEKVDSSSSTTCERGKADIKASPTGKTACRKGLERVLTMEGAHSPQLRLLSQFKKPAGQHAQEAWVG